MTRHRIREASRRLRRAEEALAALPSEPGTVGEEFAQRRAMAARRVALEDLRILRIEAVRRSL